MDPNPGKFVTLPAEEHDKLMADKQRLDNLQDMTNGHGFGWILRDSYHGGGMKLYEAEGVDKGITVRDAIDTYLNDEVEGE